MKRNATLFILMFLTLAYSLSFGQAYSEDFEDGDVSEWQQYRIDEEMIQAIDMATAPAILVGGGDKVGYIQDLDYSYSGAAILLDGEVTDMNYTVEADVYVYENATASSYTGIVASADSSHQGPHSHGYYVKLVADFDGDNRFRLYNNQLDFSTFAYTFSNSIPADNVDKTEGWHHMKVVVNTNPVDSTVSYQCFYDEIDLGTYVDDSEGRVHMGQPGVFAFQQDGVDGLAGYFDNYVVAPNTTSIDKPVDGRPVSMSLEQNFPNPFNPSTTISFDIHDAGKTSLRIIDVNGKTVATLAQGYIQPGSYKLSWNGKDTDGQIVAAGAYVAVLTRGNEQISRSMLMLK